MSTMVIPIKQPMSQNHKTDVTDHKNTMTNSYTQICDTANNYEQLQFIKYGFTAQKKAQKTQHNEDKHTEEFDKNEVKNTVSPLLLSKRSTFITYIIYNQAIFVADAKSF